MNQEALSLNELISFGLAIHERLNFYWNLYIIGITILLGWLVSYHPTKSINWSMFRALVTVGLIIFVAINISSLLGAYQLLSSITVEVSDRIDAAKAAKGEIFNTPGIETFIKKFSENLSSPRPFLMVILTHVILDVGTLAVLWADKIECIFKKVTR
jgi:hypothetical protein